MAPEVTQTTPSPDRGSAVGLDTSLQYLKGVGPRRAALLEKKGLRTVEDALFFVPLRHEDRTRFTPLSALQPGDVRTVTGIVAGIAPPPPGRPRVPLKVTLRDERGVAGAVFFNARYLTRVLKRRQPPILHGQVVRDYGAIALRHPDWEIVEPGDDERVHSGRLVPIYSLTEGLTMRPLRSLLWRIVEDYADTIQEVLPESVLA